MRGFAHAESDIGTAFILAQGGTALIAGAHADTAGHVYLDTVAIPASDQASLERDRNGDGELITIGRPWMTPPSSLLRLTKTSSAINSGDEAIEAAAG